MSYFADSCGLKMWLDDFCMDCNLSKFPHSLSIVDFVSFKNVSSEMLVAAEDKICSSDDGFQKSEQNSKERVSGNIYLHFRSLYLKGFFFFPVFLSNEMSHIFDI